MLTVQTPGRLDAEFVREAFPSVKVLAHNGFREFGRSTRSFQLRDEWEDMLHFERHAA